MKPPPPGGTCPPECTGGCAPPPSNLCYIDCTAANACQGQTLDCPANYACEVQCFGNQSCLGATINCPDAYECRVYCTCTGGGIDQCCTQVDVNCSSTGVCLLDCGTKNSACGPTTAEAAELFCGSNECTAVCSGGGSQQHPTVTCGQSCGCTECI